MNEIMKVLTILSAIFIPLSFIAGVYGMNFDTGVSHFNMPELHWVMGYPFALGLMAAVALILIVYFKVKGWF
jgi:magnesium transporter